MAAEAAVKRGEYPSAYLACKSEADTGDAECHHLVGYLYQEGLGVPLNATEAIHPGRQRSRRHGGQLRDAMAAGRPDCALCAA
jgi:hypothetical protein